MNSLPDVSIVQAIQRQPVAPLAGVAGSEQGARPTAQGCRRRQRGNGTGAPGQSTSFLIDLTSAPEVDDEVVITKVKQGHLPPRRVNPPTPKRARVAPPQQPAKPVQYVAAPAPTPPPPEPAYKCPVCLEGIERMVATPCGHVFCEGCLGSCLKIRKQCPKCRKACDPRRLHRIYLD